MKVSQNLESAISQVNCAIGSWTVDHDEDRTMLVWTAYLSDLDENRQGDEPWKMWGGDEILAIAGVGADDLKSGEDSYIDKYGDEVVASWVIVE